MKLENALQKARQEKGVLIAAHRGVSGGIISFNTRKAFDAALCQGADILETDITASGDGELFIFHAIYNMEGDITITKATIDGIEKNMLQQKGGTTVLNELDVDKIGNHGAYIDLGKVTITDSTIKNMQGNGIYLTKNDNEAIVKNVVLDGVQKQGVNNASKLTIRRSYFKYRKR